MAQAERTAVGEIISRRERKALSLVGLSRHLDVRSGDGEVYCDDDEGEQALEIQRKRGTRERRQRSEGPRTSGARCWSQNTKGQYLTF